MAEQDHDYNAAPSPGLRPNRNDPLHDLQLQRDLDVINSRNARELGLLPPGGLAVQSKRKPLLPPAAVPPASPELHPPHEEMTMQWKSAVAMAALATSGSLAACEANESRTDPQAMAESEVPARVEMPPVAALPPAENRATAQSTAPADTRAPEPERGPAIPAAQLRRQILALLASFQTLEDLERGNVEKVFGVQLQRNLKMTEGYEYKASTTEGWNYSVSVDKLDRLNQPSTILIGLDHGVEPFSNQEPTYCTLEFEPLAKELVAMGYEQGMRAYKRGRNMMWGFGRDSSTHKVGFGVGVIIYTLPSDSGVPQTCIGGFDIGGGPLDE